MNPQALPSEALIYDRYSLRSLSAKDFERIDRALVIHAYGVGFTITVRSISQGFRHVPVRVKLCVRRQRKTARWAEGVAVVRAENVKMAIRVPAGPLRRGVEAVRGAFDSGDFRKDNSELA